MTHQACIDACDLTTARHLFTLLREITPCTQPVISLEEYKQVAQTLQSWTVRLAEAVEKHKKDSP